MDNIEKSELVIANLLAQLLECGLQRNSVSFKQLGLSEEYSMFFETCVEWLRAEGILRYSARHPDLKEIIFMGVTLTSKGFALMGQVFRVGDQNLTGGDAVKAISTREANWAKPGQLIGGVLGGLIESVG